MLRGNYSVILKSPGRFYSGTTVSNNRASFNTTNASRNMYTSSFARFNGIASGYNPYYSWIPPQIGGGMAARKTVGGTGAVSGGNLAGGINIESDLTGEGTISNADLALILSAVATLSGVGTLTAAITGKLEASADLAGSGDVTGALGALASAVCSMIGTGTISSADMRAIANMSCDITPFTTLSPENLAAAVWNAIAADFNDAGTMGNKMNSAASAGDPWTTDLSSYNTAGTAGKVVKQIKSMTASQM